jgi:DNA-directed RNA polymerase
MKLRVPLLTKQHQINNNKNKKNSNSILYTIYRTPGNFTEKQIKIHPTVLHFFSHIPQIELEFDCTELPCLVSPLPWLSTTTGGYLLNQTDFVRLPVSAGQQDARLQSLPIEKIGGLLDSINVLNSCPWKINHDVLDLLIDIFQRGGSRHLSVPVSIEQAKLFEPLPLEKGLTIDERKRREIALSQIKKLKGEIFSLWCYELYRLSIANHVCLFVYFFKEKISFSFL